MALNKGGTVEVVKPPWVSCVVAPATVLSAHTTQGPTCRAGALHSAQDCVILATARTMWQWDDSFKSQLKIHCEDISDPQSLALSLPLHLISGSFAAQ